MSESTAAGSNGGDSPVEEGPVVKPKPPAPSMRPRGVSAAAFRPPAGPRPCIGMGMDMLFPPPPRVPPMPLIPPMPMPSLLPSQLGFPGLLPPPQLQDPPGYMLFIPHDVMRNSVPWDFRRPYPESMLGIPALPGFRARPPTMDAETQTEPRVVVDKCVGSGRAMSRVSDAMVEARPGGREVMVGVPEDLDEELEEPLEEAFPDGEPTDDDWTDLWDQQYGLHDGPRGRGCGIGPGKVVIGRAARGKATGAGDSASYEGRPYVGGSSSATKACEAGVRRHGMVAV